MMKDDYFKLLRGFAHRRTDICECRVAFATENLIKSYDMTSLTNVNKSVHETRNIIRHLMHDTTESPPHGSGHVE